VLVTDGKGACRWTLTDTHGGPFLGVEATGRVIEVSGIDFLHMAGEHISELWRSFDLRVLLKQIDPPEPPSS
jgi:predicted ester cyclase